MQYCVFDADARKSAFAPVTISVALEFPISTKMLTLDTLKDVDMLNTARASRGLLNFITDFWYARLEEKGWSEQDLSKLNWGLVESFMPADESLVIEFLALPEMSHLRLFVYPAMPLINPAFLKHPISLGITKLKYIVAAESPMYPNLIIDR